MILLTMFIQHYNTNNAFVILSNTLKQLQGDLLACMTNTDISLFYHDGRHGNHILVNEMVESTIWRL